MGGRRRGRTGDSRFLPFGFAQGRNDNFFWKLSKSGEGGDKSESKRRSRSLRDDSQKSKSNVNGNSKGKYRDPSLRSRMTS